jgi:hypothetical protein
LLTFAKFAAKISALYLLSWAKQILISANPVKIWDRIKGLSVAYFKPQRKSSYRYFCSLKPMPAA